MNEHVDAAPQAVHFLNFNRIQVLQKVIDLKLKLFRLGFKNFDILSNSERCQDWEDELLAILEKERIWRWKGPEDVPAGYSREKAKDG